MGKKVITMSLSEKYVKNVIRELRAYMTANELRQIVTQTAKEVFG